MTACAKSRCLNSRAAAIKELKFLLILRHASNLSRDCHCSFKGFGLIFIRDR